MRERATAKQAEEPRDRDLRLLREILDSEDPGLPDGEADAFSGMLSRLEQGQRELTPKQRRWVEDCATRLGVPLSPPVKAADVPRGREVPLPDVLRHLPKKPPGR